MTAKKPQSPRPDQLWPEGVPHPTSPPPPRATVPTVRELDTRFAERIKRDAMHGDNENDHIAADELLCELLEELGCSQSVEQFRRVGKWHA